MSEQRAAWDAMAGDFAARFEPITLLLARGLIAALDLPCAAALLEVGGGAGGAARVCRAALPEAARHVVTDLSPEMTRLARGRLGPSTETSVADAEALPFADGSFDRLLANLNLMLVGDPDRALHEAARVLRSGALAAWSVWGRPEHSPMFTVLPRAAESLGLELPTISQRSNFHLNDPVDLRGRVCRAGFHAPLAWFVPMVNPLRSGEAFAALQFGSSVSLKRLTAQLAPEALAALRARVVELADRTLASGQPLQLETLVVVARRI